MISAPKPTVVDLAAYRDRSEQLRQELALVEERHATLVRALRSNDSLIAAAIAPEQPLLPIEGLQRTARRSTTRHGRAVGRGLTKSDHRVLRIIGKGPIAFAELQERAGINEWTLRDSIRTADGFRQGQALWFGASHAVREGLGEHEAR